jgi:hypothetical protein
MILRQAHVARGLTNVADNRLNATQLRMKHEFLSQQEDVIIAAARYRSEQKGTSQLSPDKKAPITAPTVVTECAHPVVKRGVDTSLFQGLQAWLNDAEQVYLSELLTSGDVSKLVIAAHIMHGVFEASVLGHANLVATAPTSATHERRRLELEARFLKRYPLPRRMPRYATLQLPISRKDLQIRDEEDKENPSDEVADALNNMSIDGKRSDANDKKKKAPTFSKVVKITGVKGTVGRLGLRKGDIITHLNGEQYNGTALELQNMLESSQVNEVNIIVNADRFTATTLKQRAERARSGKD